MRADRLVSLALLLQAGGRMSARALAGQLEVSVRTVYRDIAALNTAGVPVVTESGPGGGCWLLEGYRFPLRGLSDDETEALLMLGVPTAVAELGLAGALTAAHAAIQVTAGHPEPTLVYLDMPRWFHPAEQVPQLRTLAQAVRKQRQLRLGYRRGDDSAETSYVVEPLGLVNKAGTWYLVASRAGAGGPAGDPAVFRAGRVTSARVLTDPFDRPADFGLAAFWDRWSASFVTSRPKIEVRIRASPVAIAAFPEVFGDASRQALDEASPPDAQLYAEVTLTFEHEAAAAHRLAGFGGEVEVLSPAAVRARLVTMSQQLLERYRPGRCDGLPGGLAAVTAVLRGPGYGHAATPNRPPNSPATNSESQLDHLDAGETTVRSDERIWISVPGQRAAPGWPVLTSPAMAETIYAGNAAADTADRGWMLGHFRPEGDARRSDDVEIKWGVHPEGETRPEWSADDGRTTLSLLISGRFRVEFPGRSVLLAAQGDYVLYRGVSHTWQAEQASVVIVIRWPSFPGD